MQLIYLLFFGLGLSFATNSSEAEEYELKIHLESIKNLEASISKRNQKIEKTEREIKQYLERCVKIRNFFQAKTGSIIAVFDDQLNLNCEAPKEYTHSEDNSTEELVEDPNRSEQDKLKDLRFKEKNILWKASLDAKSQHIYLCKELGKILRTIIYFEEKSSGLCIPFDNIQ
jgi:hypothetical protein